MTVLGGGVGSSGVTGRVRVGATGSEASKWASMSSVTVRAAGNRAPSVGTGTTCGQQRSTVSRAMSADLQSLSRVSRPNQPSTGGSSVSLFGKGLAGTDRTAGARQAGTETAATRWVRLGGSGLWAMECCQCGRLCMSLLVRAREVSVVCMIPLICLYVVVCVVCNDVLFVGSQVSQTTCVGLAAGWQQYSWGRGSGSAVCVSVEGAVGSLSGAMTLDYGSLSSVTGGNVALTGSSSLTVCGSGLSSSDTTSAARSRSAGEASVWVPSSCVSVRTTSGVTTVRQCVVASVVASRSLSGCVTMNTAALSEAVVSNQATTGASSVTVLGSQVGGSSPSNRGRLGATRGAGTGWASDSAVKVKGVSGTGRELGVVCTGGGQSGSQSRSLTVADVVVSGLIRSNLPTTGGTSVTVIGS